MFAYMGFILIKTENYNFIRLILKMCSIWFLILWESLNKM